MSLNELLKEPWVGGGIIFVFGVFLVIAGFLKFRRFGKNQCTMPAKARVQKILPMVYGERNDSAGVIIKFAAQDLTWFTVKIDDTTTPSVYNEGEDIDILYNSDDPNDFVVVSNKQDKVYFIMIGVGGLIAVIGFLIMAGIIKLNN
ncbi:MAG: hypothetical protein K0Q79_2380 [Flavipsychrobacter sp.]|jgi:hypothetical protein|nr:hypothetical protein [Flavipsychrobacter sp.]